MNCPDNYSLWLAHETEQERRLAMLPVCSVCREPIQDDVYYEIEDKLYCEDCLGGFKKYI